MLTVVQSDHLLNDEFNRRFRDIPTLNNFNEHVWSEGGEWPLLTEIKHHTITPNSVFTWPDASANARDVVQAMRLIQEMFRNRSVAGISMMCGAGKSTSLMISIAQSSSYTTVINVQPSSTAASELVAHVSTLAPALRVVRTLDLSVKSLVYMSAGEFIARLHESLDIGNALVVIDESHSINPVYKALEKILGLVNSHKLCVTASSTSNLRPRPGVTINGLDRLDNTITRTIASSVSDETSTKLIVGCSSGLQVYRSANQFVGLTLNVDTVIDLATRLDPTYDEAGLIMTYRAANVPEITQMLGRLARFRGTTGIFNYMISPGQFLYSGRPKLYSRVYDALISAFGLGIETNPASVKNTLACVSSPVLSSISSNISSRSTNVTAPSVQVSRRSGHSNSGSSNVSSLRSPRDNETQKIRQASHGYFVDYVPKDPMKRIFSTRASSWSSNPLETHLTSFDRQNMLLSSMSTPQANEQPIPMDITPEPPLLEPLHNEELVHVNDILAGRIIPTYQPEEMVLVQRAWQSFLAVNSSRFNRITSTLEYNIRIYFNAYRRLDELRRNIKR